MERAAVVTGGGTGLGRAIAAALVEAGVHVVITGRRRHVLADAAHALGGRVRAVAFDVTDPAAVTAALDDLPDTIDILVNNAGGVAEWRLPARSPADLVALRTAWLANLEANLLGAVLVTEAVKPRLTDNGRVVNIGSIAAKMGGAGYGAAKAGLETWTGELAFDLGPRGITVNVVAPGAIEGSEVIDGWVDDRRRAWFARQAANRRLATPAEVAAVVAFLVSPPAGHFTGQVIPVNGGAKMAR